MIINKPMTKASGNRRQFLKTAGLAAVAGATSCAEPSPTIKSGKKRIMVAHFFDETNTFIPENVTLEDVKKRAIIGNDLLTSGGMVHGIQGTSLDGFLDFMDMHDVELIASISAAGDYRLMTEQAFDYVTGVILKTLDKDEVDAVYLSMHGAGTTIGHDDLEGDTLELVRQKV